MCNGVGSARECRAAEYSSFSLGNKGSNYQLSVAGFSSPNDAGDSLTYHSGMGFSAKDRDQDGHSSHCATSYVGAWWYRSCHYSNLNGLYGDTSYAKGMFIILDQHDKNHF